MAFDSALSYRMLNFKIKVTKNAFKNTDAKQKFLYSLLYFMSEINSSLYGLSCLLI